LRSAVWLLVMRAILTYICELIAKYNELKYNDSHLGWWRMYSLTQHIVFDHQI